MINNFANKLLASSASCMSDCLGGGQGAQECARICSPGDTSAISNPALGTFGNNTGVGFFQKLIPSLVALGLIVGALVFFFMLITGAIQWISSGGDKQSLEGARGKISNALIGLVILFAVFAIVKLIERFFGISILTLDISNLIIR